MLSKVLYIESLYGMFLYDVCLTPKPISLNVKVWMKPDATS